MSGNLAERTERLEGNIRKKETGNKGTRHEFLASHEKDFELCSTYGLTRMVLACIFRSVFMVRRYRKRDMGSLGAI